jgi:hypothetical protein
LTKYNPGVAQMLVSPYAAYGECVALVAWPASCEDVTCGVGADGSASATPEPIARVPIPSDPRTASPATALFKTIMINLGV